MKSIFRTIPLVYFTLLGFFWIAENYMTTGLVNFMAIGVTFLVALQLFFMHRAGGIATGVFMALLCAGMLIIQFEDYFDVYYTTSTRFLVLNSIVFGMGIIMAVMLALFCIKSRK